MLTQTVVLGCLGALIGSQVGALIYRSRALTQATLPLLRIGYWLPLFVGWALPVWALSEESLPMTVSVVIGIGLVTVSLAACYYYLTARLTLTFTLQENRLFFVRATLLQSLLVSLVSQVWLRPYGWNWFLLSEPGGVAVGYTTLALILIVIAVFQFVTKFSFTKTTENCRAAMSNEFKNINSKSLLLSALLILLFFVVWQLAAALDRKGNIVAPLEPMIWINLGISLFELILGVSLSVSISVLTTRTMSTNPFFRESAFQWLPFTAVTSLLSPLLIIYWVPQFAVPWATITSVASMSYFSIVQILWGLGKQPLKCRLLLAMYEAMPFAFLGLLFGETMAATAGLGFFVTIASNIGRPVVERLAGAMVIVILFVFLSATIGTLGKRKCTAWQA
jgi:ABC-type nitrate/sulfonate/bicarbonate transport system permease component